MVKRLYWPIVLSLLLDRISGSFASYMVHRIFSSGSHCQANTNIGDTRGNLAILLVFASPKKSGIQKGCQTTTSTRFARDSSVPSKGR